MNIVERLVNEPLPFSQPHTPSCNVETKENLLEICSEVATGTDSNTICESGEFYLEMAEWDSICVTDWNGKMSLEGNWTNIFADKFHDINNMCVLKFKNYWFKKIDSRKVNSPLLRARAECKFDNCRVYTFYIDDETSSSNDCIVVKFCFSFTSAYRWYKCL